MVRIHKLLLDKRNKLQEVLLQENNELMKPSVVVQ